MEIITQAIREGRTMLSEYESKQVLNTYNIPITREAVVANRDELLKAAHEIGYPVVLKGCSQEIAHKTEKGLIVPDIRTDKEAEEAFEGLNQKLEGLLDGKVLIQEMVAGKRELMVGLTRDQQFGPCVMFGLGGIFSEILKDVSFRLAPLTRKDALEMMAEIKGRKILDAVRGMAPVNQERLADIIINVGRIGLENERVKEIDINPVIIADTDPVAVDALIVLE
jgi:acetyl-CoA synthetase (ADP-forming)